MAALTPRIARCFSQINSLTNIRAASKYVPLHNLCKHRSIHAACHSHFSRLQNKSFKLYSQEKSHWYRVIVVRFNSTTTPVTTVPIESVVSYIPEPPPIPIMDSDIADVVQTIGEPTLVSLGLGGWTPVGVLQHGLEFLHIGMDLPWFVAIALGTCIVRFVMFPLVVLTQRNAAKMNNNMPQMQILQMKMTEARRNGDALEAAKYAYELAAFMKEKNMSPFKNFLVPLCQMPVFLSFFFALRGLANLPLEGFKTGGTLWFTNLTLADPFYILPTITSLTMLATLELGIESGMRSDNMQMMRYVFRAMPFVIFPFIMNFPSAVLCYWVTSNFLSLIQAAILRVPPIREYFKIEPLVHHSAESLPMKKKNMRETLKETIANAKIAKEIEERGRVDDIRFRQSAVGPIQKTYSYNPTKQKPTSQGPAPVEAKPTNRH